MGELICEVCKKPITKSDIWVHIESKSYHLGCAPLRKVHSSNPILEPVKPRIIH